MENSGVFNDFLIETEVERNESVPRVNANLSQSQGNPVHTQNYCRLMFGCQKGKNG